MKSTSETMLGWVGFGETGMESGPTAAYCHLSNLETSTYH